MQHTIYVGNGKILINGEQRGPLYANHQVAVTEATRIQKVEMPHAQLIIGPVLVTKPRLNDEEAKIAIEAEKLAKKAQKKADSEKKKAAIKEAAAKLRAANKQAKADEKEKARLAALPVLPPPPVHVEDACPVAC